MSVEQNKAAVRHFVERGINQKNLDEFDIFYAPDTERWSNTGRFLTSWA